MFLDKYFKKFFDRFLNKKRDKQKQQIEDEFNKGNIVLPTGLRDYENYEEFKNKTSHLENIKESLNVIENNGK